MQDKDEFVISRMLDAPRDVVWAAFTDAERMKHWFGPKGAVILTSKMDFRVGGTYHYGMRYAGADMWGKFIYREIDKPKKIVFVNSFSDEQGGVTRHPMAPNWPLMMLSTVTLEDHSGQTKFTIKWAPITPTDAESKAFKQGHASMIQGWSGTFEQLEAYLAKHKE